MEWKNTGGGSISREEGWKREKEDRMLTCMRGFTVGTGLLQIWGIGSEGKNEIKNKKPKTKPSRDARAGLVVSYIVARERREKMFTSLSMKSENKRRTKDSGNRPLSDRLLYSTSVWCVRVLQLVTRWSLSRGTHEETNWSRWPLEPTSALMSPMAMSTKGAKEERGSHWCCRWGFLSYSPDPQMMWGRSGSHHGPFAALKILLAPFQTGGGKHKCSTSVFRPNKNTSLLQSWQEHIVRGRTIVIHDNPLKQSKVCCALCCDRAEKHIMARSWNERCSIPVWEVRILFSFTWTSPWPVSLFSDTLYDTRSPPPSLGSILRHRQRVC